MKKKLIGTVAAAVALLMLMSVCTAAFADESAIDTIFSAGTTQAFTDEPVSDEDLNTILRAGLSAASAINQQPWFFVAVRDPEVIGKISGSGAGFTPPAGGFPGGDAPAGMPAGGPPAGAPGGSGSPKAGLGDSPVAIIIYMDEHTSSPNASFDCGLAAQNMYIAAVSLGYGVKIVSSPTMSLNGSNHDAFCELLGADPSLQAVAVLLIGRPDTGVDLTTGATARFSLSEKTNIIG